MDSLLTVVISLVGSAITSFLVAKYYGERWVEKRRSCREHSVRLKDDFLQKWLTAIHEYCRIDATYSKKTSQMVALEPREPSDLRFYDEAWSHLSNYGHLVNDWKNLKQITLELNRELAVLFEEIRILTKSTIDLPYYCQWDFGDEPDEYLCPNTFVRAVYEEMENRLNKGKKQFIGIGNVSPTNYGEKRIYHFKWWDRTLARSPNEELMKRAQDLLSQLFENEKYKQEIRTFVAKQRETYDEQLEKVQQDIREIIKSVELGNIIKGNCRYCP